MTTMRPLILALCCTSLLTSLPVLAQTPGPAFQRRAVEEQPQQQLDAAFHKNAKARRRRLAEEEDRALRESAERAGLEEERRAKDPAFQAAAERRRWAVEEMRVNRSNAQPRPVPFPRRQGDFYRPGEHGLVPAVPPGAPPGAVPMPF